MIILDTHAWLWWLHAPENLSKKALSVIQRKVKTREVIVSVISVWEVAVKVEVGKLKLPMELRDWFCEARKYDGIAIESLDPMDAIASTVLPGSFHKDPADRILVAIARRYQAPLVTRDKTIALYPHVETLW